MLALLMMGFLFFLIVETVSMRKILKHDKHLFQFRTLHDDAIKYLCVNFIDLSKKEYVEMRQIINMSSITLEMYNHKYKIFNYRDFRKTLNTLDSKLEEVDLENSESKKEIEEYKVKFVVCTFNAFLAYTPFLRSEILLKLFYFIISKAIKAGIKPLMPLEEDLLIIKKRHEEVDRFKLSSNYKYC